METPPHRIALSVLILLVLTGVVAWWSQSKRGVTKPAATPDATTGVNAPAVATTEPPLAFDDMPGDPATQAAFEQCENALKELVRERAARLADRQDATSQLAYALTINVVQAWPVDGTQADATRMAEEMHGASRRAFVRAGRLDPGDPDITWLAADQCFDGTSCDAIQQALLRSEPDNIAAWLRAMAWARRRGDDDAVDAAFSRAASASRYDTHKGSGVLKVLEGYAGLPTPGACQDPDVQALARRKSVVTDTATFVQMFSSASQFSSSMSFAQLYEFCKTRTLAMKAANRRAGCSHIYAAMAEGPSPLERSIAISQLIELAGDTSAGAEWRERYRQLRWMLEQQRQPYTQTDFVGMVTNEVDTMEAALRAAGRWPPPADWLPEDESARSLIQTGHPPPSKTR